MAEFFKTIDRVGKEFKFTIDGKESFKTIMGGVISLFYYMGLIALFFYFGRDLYQKNDPNFITRQDVLEEYNFKDINDNNFFITFSFYNGVDSVYNLSYFDVYSEYYSIEKAKTNYQAVIPIPTVEEHKKCSDETINRKLFSSLDLNNSYCFNNINYTIGGYWTNEILKFPAFKVVRCNKKTEIKHNITCASDEEISNKFPLLYLMVYYQNNMIYPQIFDNPYKAIYQTEIDILNLQLNKHYNYELVYKEGNVTTDAGLIFEDPTSESFLELDYTNYDNSHNLFFGEYLMTVSILLSKNITFYSRTYIRLQDVIANVGSFMDLLLVIILFFHNFYLDNEYSVFLYSKLFKFQIDSQDNELNPLKYINDNINNSKENNNITKTEIKENELNNINNINNLEYNDENINDKINEVQYIKSANYIDNTVNKDITDNNKVVISNYINVNNDADSADKVNNVNNVIELKSSRSDYLVSNSKNIEKKYINNNLKQIIRYKSKKRNSVEISLINRFSILFCPRSYFSSDKISLKERYIKKKLLTTADKLIDSKSEILELWKVMDQFNVLKKIFLNEHQCFMLKNKGVKVIVEKVNEEDNEKIDSKNDNQEDNEDDDKEKNNELKEEETRLNLIEYLKNKKLNGEFITDNNFNNLDNLDRLDHFDNLLWVYLNEELQQKLQEELNKIK